MLPTGVLLTVLSMVLWENVLELTRQIAEILLPMAIPIQVGLPLLLLAAARLRGKGGRPLKRKIALASLVFLLFAAGCWNRVELDKRAIVAGFGADKAEEEGKIKVTVQIIKPGEIKAGPAARMGSPKAVVVYTGTGYTFFDTLRNLAMVAGKKIFISESKILVVGEDLAREGIGKVTDLYERDREMSTRNYLLIAKGRQRKSWRRNWGLRESGLTASVITSKP